MISHAHFGWQSASLREKRLLYRDVEVLPDQVLETFLQDSVEVDRLEQAVGTLDEASPVYRAMLERSKSLTEQQRSVIDSNCQRLQEQSKAKVETLRKIGLLQRGINASRQTPAANVPAQPNAIERTWEWTKNKAQAGWERTKEFAQEHPTLTIAVGSTLGVALIYKLWKWWRGEKKGEGDTGKNEEKSTKKESKFWKIVKWIPGVGLVALLAAGAGYGIYEGVQWMKKNLSSLDQAKALLANAENRLKSMVGLGNKAEQYGLSEENYHKAVRAYREVYQENPEKGAEIIRSISGLKDGETSPDYQKFMEDMGRKFERKPENGIMYAHVDIAIENYEQHFESALKHLEQWIVEHRYEALFAVYIANRFGLLLPIIKEGGSAAVRAVKISKEMLTWGIGHPIISLFAAGGAVLGMRAAVKAGKELWMPENFTQLGKAFNENKRILLPAEESAMVEKAEELKDHVVAFARSGEDFGPWALKKFGEYVKALDAKVPELLGASREKIVFENNSAGLGNLQRWLEERKENAPTDTEDIQSKIGEKCDDALAKLEVFQKVFLENRCSTQVVGSNRPQQALEPLRQSLDVLQITLVTGADGILRWKQQSGNAIDLCVNPAVTSKDEIFRISSRMRFGEESGLSHFCSRIVQHSRLFLGEGTEVGKKLPFAGRSDVMAMVIGQFLYVADLRHIRDFVIFKVPRDVVSGLWNEPTKWDKAATVATGMAETGLFSLSASVLGTTIKRFAVGGGPIFRFNAAEMIQGSIPGWAQWKMLRDTYRGGKDVSLMKNFVSEYRSGSGLLNRFSGYRRAWYISTVLGKAGVKNIEWVGIIEHSQDLNELNTIAGKLGLRHLITPGLTPDAARTILKNSIFDCMKKVKMRELSLRNWLTRLIFSGPVRDYQAIWNDVLTWYNAKTGLPPPLPIAPPPVSGGAAVPPPLPKTSGVPPPLPKAKATPPPLPGSKTAAATAPTPPTKPVVSPPPLPKTPGAQPPPLPQSPSAPVSSPVQPSTKPASSPLSPPESKPVSSTATATETSPSKLTPADRGVRSNVPDGEGASALGGQPEGVKQVARQGAAAEMAERSVETLDDLKKQVRSAQQAGNHAEVARLLHENRAALKAAEGTDEEAKVLLRALEGAEKVQAKWARFVGPGLAGLGVLVDVLLVSLNEWEISRARQQGNAGLAEALRKKRQSLVGAGAGGLVWGTGEYALTAAVGAEAANASIPFLSVGSAAAPGWLAGGVLAIPVAWAGIHSEAIFDAVKEWNKDEQAYLQEDGAALLSEIQRKETERTVGQGAAYGDTTFQWLWKKLSPTWSKKEYEDYYRKMYENSEHINRNMREKMFSVYFLQYTQPLLAPGDLALAQERTHTLIQSQGVDDVQKQQELFQQTLAAIVKPRVQEAVVAKRHFLQSVLMCDFWTVPPLELAKADAYAELVQLRQQLQKQGKPLAFRYRTANGEERMLDLAEFGKSGDLLPEVRMSIQDVVLKYHEEVQVTNLFRKHFQKSALIYAADGSQKEVAQSAFRHEVRADVLHRIRHSILRAEQRIRDSAFSAEKKDVVRLQLKHEFEEKFSTFMTLLSNPACSFEDYRHTLHGLELIWEDANRLENVYQRNQSALKEAIERPAAPVAIPFGIVDTSFPAIQAAKRQIPSQDLAGFEHLLDEVDIPSQEGQGS